MNARLCDAASTTTAVRSDTSIRPAGPPGSSWTRRTRSPVSISIATIVPSPNTQYACPSRPDTATPLVLTSSYSTELHRTRPVRRTLPARRRVARDRRRSTSDDRDTVPEPRHPSEAPTSGVDHSSFPAVERDHLLVIDLHDRTLTIEGKAAGLAREASTSPRAANLGRGSCLRARTPCSAAVAGVANDTAAGAARDDKCERDDGDRTSTRHGCTPVTDRRSELPAARFDSADRFWHDFAHDMTHERPAWQRLAFERGAYVLQCSRVGEDPRVRVERVRDDRRPLGARRDRQRCPGRSNRSRRRSR